MQEQMPEANNNLTSAAGLLTRSDVEAVDRLREAYQTLNNEVAKVIVGQTAVLEELLIALFCRGHCLLVGVPGLAKTLMVRTLARALDLGFKRIQFTPDLMPADITGTDIIQEDPETKQRGFVFLKGPVFSNILLADEINRTPPKTQAALLEAMQEHQVTASGRLYKLDEPFLVLATQNPIEQEGTYPLPEAQLDRFMFDVNVDYPSEEEELEIVQTTTTSFIPEIKPVLTGQDIIELQRIVLRTPVPDHVYKYALQLSRSTRPRREGTPDYIDTWVSWGAGPRATQYLILGAKARSILHGRYCAVTEDIRAVAHPVMRHRIVTNFNAESEGIDQDHIIARLLKSIPAGKEEKPLKV